MDEQLRAQARRAAQGEPGERERWELQALRAGLPVVRTAGVYRCHPEEAHWVSWLRFYPDGLVLVVSTIPSATPADLLRWFAPHTGHLGRGAWTLDGARLSFVSTSAEGRVDYEGVVEGEELLLDTHSHINGWRAKLRYAWVPLPP